MQAHRTIAIVSENGSVTIEKLPFPAGQPVEVVVFPAETQSHQGLRYPLRGTPIRFVDPTEPVAESDWEVAKLVELGRLSLPVALGQWFTEALSYPGVTLVELTPSIAIESTGLSGSFHRDPADQIIVAASRVLGCDLLTADQRIRDYPHVDTP